MIAWPTINGKRIGIVLRSSDWDAAPGIIADKMRSGKMKWRANHVKVPDTFNVVMNMSLHEYRVFRAWWNTTDRKGLYTFAYPRIDDTTGELVEYQFDPDSHIKKINTTGDNIQVSMTWLEAV